MASYLDRIIAAHRAALYNDRRIDDLVAKAAAAPPARDFKASLLAEGLSVIAECKRRSPSKGAIDEALDPASLALSYERGGAAALSVLTDEEFFGGSLDDLRVGRLAVEIPVLRKDFTLSDLDIYEARANGADAVLLIVAALSDSELAGFLRLSSELGMSALVETHDQVEVERAVQAGATIVGVNQRNLSDFKVDVKRAAALFELMPPDIVKVAESGISSPADARQLSELGYDAVLVGEYLLRSEDRSAAVASLRSGTGISSCS